MRSYIIRRFIYMIFIFLIISVLAFIIIQLPPGNYLTYYLAHLSEYGQDINPDSPEAQILRKKFGLDLPIYLQYFKWMWNMLQGDFGKSFKWGKPVISLLAERIPLTEMLH